MLKIKLFQVVLFTLILTISIIGFFLFKKIYFINQSQNLNLILISVDTLRPDHMGVYGYNKNTTPNIDKWAKEAMIFTKMYTIFPSTLQSFYSLFTGQNDAYRDNYLTQNPNQLSTLTKEFKDHSFTTAAFVTNPVLGTITPFFKQYFDQFSFFNTGGNITGYDINSYAHDYQSSTDVTNASLDWLRTNSRKKFFLWLHYTTPHMPYNPPTQDICKIDMQCDLDKYKELLAENMPYNTILKSCSKDDKTPQETINLAQNLYDAEILSVDEQVGRILDELKKLHLYDKSVLVFYGDHGEGFDHNMFGHESTLYESAIRIPFIIRHPFHIQNTTQYNKTLTDNTDILPTLLDFFHFSYDKISFSGRNNTEPRPYVFSITGKDKTNKLAVNDGQYKYIYSNNDKCLYKEYKEELYDLRKDPQELSNLIGANSSISITKYKTIVQTLGKQFGLIDNNYIDKPDPLLEERKEKLKSIGY